MRSLPSSSIAGKVVEPFGEWPRINFIIIILKQKGLSRFIIICQYLFMLSARVRNSTPRFASTPEPRNENINVNKYYIFSSGNRTYNQLILQSPAPRLGSIHLNKFSK